MKLAMKGFFTSGWDFSESELNLKNKFQMINITLLLSSLAFIFGIVINIIKEIPGFVPVELLLLLINIILFFVLRTYRESFKVVSTIITIQSTFLLLLIIYKSEPASMKYIWIFTYPIILLYFQEFKNGLYWFGFMLFMLIAAPLQNFIEINFSIFQVLYIAVVLIVIAAIVYFYQIKMQEARDLILQQRHMLLDFNSELAKQVEKKTLELRELNENLEIKVQDKIEKLIEKDEILTTQSKQAVMGEMISMIAHQWRQPLSMITLQISNLEITRLLGNQVSADELYKTLSKISDTIIYLSDTIDDFQTYFHPNKEVSQIDIFELLQRAITFSEPRVKNQNIEIILAEKRGKVLVQTYANELLQVILNILNNATDVLTEREIEKPKVTLRVENKEEKVKIYIEDNAGGISKENLPRIFEPYFSTKGKNGTGLGLYMSQMIIEKQFGGEIRVESSSQGTTFTVEIPKKIV